MRVTHTFHISYSIIINVFINIPMFLLKETIEERIDTQKILENQLKLLENTKTQINLMHTRFIKAKRQQKLRELKQLRFVNSLNSQRVLIWNSYKLFLDFSREIMRNYSFIFDAKDHNSQQNVESVIVKLYYEFFKQNGDETKAQEILNLDKNKNFQLNFLLPTLISWLVQWTRISYRRFLKETIKSLEQNYKAKYATIQPSAHKSTLKSSENKMNTVQFTEQNVTPSKYFNDNISSNLSYLLKSNDQDKNIKQRYQSLQQKNNPQKQKSLKKYDIDLAKLSNGKDIYYSYLVKYLNSIYKSLKNVMLDLDIDYLKEYKQSDSVPNQRNIQVLVQYWISCEQKQIKNQIKKYLKLSQKRRKSKRVVQTVPEYDLTNNKSQSSITQNPPNTIMKMQKVQPPLISDRAKNSLDLINETPENHKLKSLQNSQKLVINHLRRSINQRSLIGYSPRLEQKNKNNLKQIINRRYIELNLPKFQKKQHETIIKTKLESRKHTSQIYILQKSFQRQKNGDLDSQIIDMYLQKQLQDFRKNMKNERSKLNISLPIDSEVLQLNKKLQFCVVNNASHISKTPVSLPKI